MTEEKDIVKKWFICDKKALITMTKTTNLVSKAKRLHGLTKTTTDILGRCLTMSVLMSTKLSHPNSNITSIVSGNGSVGKIICVAKPNAQVKGYLDNPEVDLPCDENGKINIADAVGSEGKLRVLMDLGFGQPYAGEVDLVTGEIVEDYVKYYYTSLQQPCAIGLGVLMDVENNVECSAGFLIEVLPDADDKVIANLEKIVASIDKFNDTINQLSIDEFVNKFFEDNERLDYEICPSFQCNCGKERLISIFKSMDKTEVDSLFDDAGVIESRCDFCNNVIRITREDLLD